MCYSGNLDAARKLFSLAPTTLTTQNNEGRTSLMEAAYFGYTEIIVWLLDQSETLINVTDGEGRTALDCCY